MYPIALYRSTLQFILSPFYHFFTDHSLRHHFSQALFENDFGEVYQETWYKNKLLYHRMDDVDNEKTVTMMSQDDKINNNIDSGFYTCDDRHTIVSSLRGWRPIVAGIAFKKEV